MTPLASLLLAALSPAVAGPREGEAAPSPAELASAGWVTVDGVCAQVGSEVITWRDLERRVQSSTPPSPQAKALEDLRVLSLMAQAGADLGFPPERLEEIVSHNQEAQRRKQGARGFADLLAESGIDPQAARSEQVRQLHQDVWRGIQLGQLGPGGEQRVIRDSYARPGILRSYSRVRNRALQSALGEPDRVRLQDLLVAAEQAGGREAAAALAAELADRAREGEDFSLLVEEFSAGDRAGQGLSDWLEPDRLADRAVGGFAAAAAPGDVSDPLPLRHRDGSGEVVGYRIVRLHERQEGRPAPPFANRETQAWLRRDYEGAWRNAVFEREMGALFAGSHFWVDPALEAPPAAGEAPRPRP
ncbi:MAG: peptidylprolyl isomerase [Planctomycetota bacterium]